MTIKTIRASFLPSVRDVKLAQFPLRPLYVFVGMPEVIEEGQRLQDVESVTGSGIWYLQRRLVYLRPRDTAYHLDGEVAQFTLL